jgi:hypothetical protein
LTTTNADTTAIATTRLNPPNAKMLIFIH